MKVYEGMSTERLKEEMESSEKVLQGLKTAKFAVGVVSVGIAGALIMQGYLMNLLAQDQYTWLAGVAGVIVGILLMISGVIMIVTRNSERKVGEVSVVILEGLAMYLCKAWCAAYSDLGLWSNWLLVCVLFVIVSLVVRNQYSRLEVIYNGRVSEGRSFQS